MADARPNGNTPLVVHFALRHRAALPGGQLPRGLDWQDFLQEGEIGLAEATRKFDSARGGSFEVYARKWIGGYLRAVVASVSLNPLGMTFKADPDEVPDRRDDAEADRLATEVWDAVEGLDSRGREAVIRRFGLDGCGAESEEVAAWNMGLGVKNLRRIVREAKATMRVSMVAGR